GVCSQSRVRPARDQVGSAKGPGNLLSNSQPRRQREKCCRRSQLSLSPTGLQYCGVRVQKNPSPRKLRNPPQRLPHLRRLLRRQLPVPRLLLSTKIPIGRL